MTAAHILQSEKRLLLMFYVFAIHNGIFNVKL